MRKRGLKLLGLAALAMSLFVNVPVNAEELPTDAVTEIEAPADEEIAMVADGWITNSDGSYSYRKDGNLVYGQVVKIGSLYYGFDWDGIMYENQEFGSNIIIDGTYYWKNFKAKANGSLYTNMWEQAENGQWRYFGSDGGTVTGLQTIGGKTYYFEGGWMSTNKAFTHDDKSYVCDSNGYVQDMPQTGWKQVDGVYYYSLDGNVQLGCALKIGSAYYAFDYDGRMITNRDFTYWDPDSSNNVTVRAKSDGTLYVNSWFRDNGAWYYYGAEGKSRNGQIITIGGTKYYSGYGGEIYEDTFMNIDGVPYYCKKGGAMVAFNKGWNSIGSDWYYVKEVDGELQTCIGTVEKIGSKYYLFRDDGKMNTSSEYTIYDNGQKFYKSGADGVVVTNTWDYKYAQDGSKQYFYYGADGASKEGVLTIGGKTYVFDYDGIMYTNTVINCDGITYKIDGNGYATALKEGWNLYGDKWYYVIDGTVPSYELVTIGGKTYGFGDGYLLTNCVAHLYKEGVGENWYLLDKDGIIITTKGWNKLNGEWYYVNEDGTLYVGLFNDKYYLAPEMLHNDELIVLDDMAYQAKTYTGVLTPITKDGFYYATGYGSEVNGNDMYYVEGGKIYTGWKKIGNFWYYMDPRVATGEHYIDGKTYWFDGVGHMMASTWVDGGRRYATSSGALAQGETVIGSKTYYFNQYNHQLINSVESDNYNITIYDDGIKKTYKFKDGWNSIGSDYYYVINGKLVTDDAVSVGGKVYCFDNSGKMITSDKKALYYINKHAYIIGSSGVAVTGWVKLGDLWYYADPTTAEICYGNKIIGGKTYGLDEYTGVMLTGDVLQNGIIYTYNSNGILTKTTTVTTGWYSVNNDGLYFKGGKIYSGWLGNSYIIEGAKQFYRVVPDYWYNGNKYYVDGNGNYVKSQWIDDCMYAKSTGVLACDEWYSIGGTWYYFDGIYKATNCVLKLDGKFYFFDNAGKTVKTLTTVQDGWYAAGNAHYFAYAGEFVKSDIMYIGGVNYSFNWGGQMEKSDISWENDREAYFESTGALTTATGWKKIDGSWYYIDDNNMICYGWLRLGSNWYFCNEGGMVTGYYTINGHLYYFDANGVMKYECVKENGWYTAGGNSYYFVDGKLLTDTTKVIDGAEYAFDWDGQMVKNGAYYSHYLNRTRFYGSDGKVVNTVGYVYDGMGGKAYVSKDGALHEGCVYINGTVMYLQGVKWGQY